MLVVAFTHPDVLDFEITSESMHRRVQFRVIVSRHWSFLTIISVSLQISLKQFGRGHWHA